MMISSSNITEGTTPPFSLQCRICLEPFNSTTNPPIILTPCGHTYICSPCANPLKECIECKIALKTCLDSHPSSSLIAESSCVMLDFKGNEDDMCTSEEDKYPKHVLLLSLTEAADAEVARNGRNRGDNNSCTEDSTMDWNDDESWTRCTIAGMIENISTESEELLFSRQREEMEIKNEIVFNSNANKMKHDHLKRTVRRTGTEGIIEEQQDVLGCISSFDLTDGGCTSTTSTTHTTVPLEYVDYDDEDDDTDDNSSNYSNFVLSKERTYSDFTSNTLPTTIAMEHQSPIELSRPHHQRSSSLPGPIGSMNLTSESDNGIIALMEAEDQEKRRRELMKVDFRTGFSTHNGIAQSLSNHPSVTRPRKVQRMSSIGTSPITCNNASHEDDNSMSNYNTINKAAMLAIDHVNHPFLPANKADDKSSCTFTASTNSETKSTTNRYQLSFGLKLPSFDYCTSYSFDEEASIIMQAEDLSVASHYTQQQELHQQQQPHDTHPNFYNDSSANRSPINNYQTSSMNKSKQSQLQSRLPQPKEQQTFEFFTLSNDRGDCLNKGYNSDTSIVTIELHDECSATSAISIDLILSSSADDSQLVDFRTGFSNHNGISHSRCLSSHNHQPHKRLMSAHGGIGGSNNVKKHFYRWLKHMECISETQIEGINYYLLEEESESEDQSESDSGSEDIDSDSADSYDEYCNTETYTDAIHCSNLIIDDRQNKIINGTFISLLDDANDGNQEIILENLQDTNQNIIIKNTANEPITDEKVNLFLDICSCESFEKNDCCHSNHQEENVSNILCSTADNDDINNGSVDQYDAKKLELDPYYYDEVLEEVKRNIFSNKKMKSSTNSVASILSATQKRMAYEYDFNTILNDTKKNNYKSYSPTSSTSVNFRTGFSTHNGISHNSVRHQSASRSQSELRFMSSGSYVEIVSAGTNNITCNGFLDFSEWCGSLIQYYSVDEADFDSICLPCNGRSGCLSYVDQQ